MKKLLHLLLLLFCLISKAQNIDLLKKANKCDFNFARTLSDDIISTAKTKYIFLTSKQSNYLQLVTFVYVKEGITETEKKGIEAYLAIYTGRYELQLDNCITVHFKVNHLGANPDLEIEGTKEYVFDFVKGKFLDLYPFYQKNIEPTATTEKTLTTQIYSVRKDADGYWYNFAKTQVDNLWYLKNMSSRLK
ncbi:hypothetical protein QWY99_06140 [Flavobacterium branchiarum]|uniref:DUF4468 domain-containing protein n=1 Tax=Flavobacterium branchiarum TaxID=1114870 RepID=A0ABV5FML8_9FLAO|nr:hypothetical protein [Flavobacterium branchiarum]MDN3672633.1 hypothetical protein [Flavobacterium branchiarum]